MNLMLKFTSYPQFFVDKYGFTNFPVQRIREIKKTESSLALCFIVSFQVFP